MSDNNIEQLAYDISEKLDANEIGELMTYFKLIQHGMNLATVYETTPGRIPKAVTKDLVAMDEITELKDEPPAAPVQQKRRGRPAKAVAKPAEDDENVF